MLTFMFQFSLKTETAVKFITIIFLNETDVWHFV